MSTPSQAPVSREEWRAKLRDLTNASENMRICTGTRFEAEAQYGYRQSLVDAVDSIMALQSSNERMAEGIRQWCEAFQALVPQEAKEREDAKVAALQAEVERLREESRIACLALRRIESRAEGDDADPWWIASSATFSIEKARQPK